MTRFRLGALCAFGGLIAAAACGSDDGKKSLPTPTGDAGALEQPTAGQPTGGISGSASGGAASGNGGALPTSGEGGMGEGGNAIAGAAPQVQGGASGDHSGGGAGEALGGTGGAADEPPLFADSFEGETLETQGLYTTNYVEFAQWDASSGTVDVTVLPNGFIDSPGNYGPGRAGEGIVVDLNGSTNQDGKLETKQPLSLAAGVSYTLRYSLANAKNQTNAVTVRLGNVVLETRSLSAISEFTRYQTTFTPTDELSAKLVFESLGGGDSDGLLLDNVSLSL